MLVNNYDKWLASRHDRMVNPLIILLPFRTHGYTRSEIGFESICCSTADAASSVENHGADICEFAIQSRSKDLCRATS
ncbi:hypothetical protein D3C77_665120 [compost metagenome]